MKGVGVGRGRACKRISTFSMCKCRRQRYEWLNDRVSAHSVKIATSAGPLKPSPLAERDVMVVLSLSREECGTDIEATRNALPPDDGLLLIRSLYFNRMRVQRVIVN